MVVGCDLVSADQIYVCIPYCWLAQGQQGLSRDAICVFCVQFAIYAAYAGQLEAAFLTDELASASAVLQGTALPPKSPFSNLTAATAADVSKGQQSQLVPLPSECCMYSTEPCSSRIQGDLLNKLPKVQSYVLPIGIEHLCFAFATCPTSLCWVALHSMRLHGVIGG